MPCSNGKTYIVQSGDILYDIAQRELGDGNRWREIRKTDGTPFTEIEAQNLQPGDEICLPTSSPNSGKIFVGYFESWSDWKKEQPLSGIASYVNMVMLSFMMPNTTYEKGSYRLGKKGEGTGLEFSADGVDVKKAIASLKQKNPETKVLISVGGWGYRQYFKDLVKEDQHVQAIVDVVDDFDLDGVDICYEPTDIAQCEMGANGKVRCEPTDDQFPLIVKKLRSKLPRPKLLTLCGWSIGAYGEGDYATAKPTGMPLTGLMLNLLRSPEAALLDQLNIMSYDAGAEYDPQEALLAYQREELRQYFKGKIVMGVQVPPEAWPPEKSKKYVCTIPKVRKLTQFTLDQNADGMMLWSLQKQPEGPVTDSNPNPEMIAQEICEMLSLGDSTAPLFQH